MLSFISWTRCPSLDVRRNNFGTPQNEIIREIHKESNVPDQIKTENQDVEGDIIYLTNIKLISLSNRANTDGAFMAFRIDAIDGFVFGGMTQS